MAGEQQQTNQSSQQGSSQSGQQDGGTAAGASNSKQATAGSETNSQQQNGQQQTQAPTRPDWVPNDFWDPKDGVKGKDLVGKFNELAAAKAAEDSKRLALPQKPEEYPLELPKDFKLPDGITFKIDADGDQARTARAWAHKHGVSKEAFTELMGVYGAGIVGDQATLKAARDAQIDALGANGTARVTALNTFLDAKGYGPLKNMMVTAEIVTTLEKLIADMTNAGNFSQQHRTQDTAQKVSDEEWNRMSPSERREYASKFPQPVQQQNGRAA